MQPYVVFTEEGKNYGCLIKYTLQIGPLQPRLTVPAIKSANYVFNRDFAMP